MDGRFDKLEEKLDKISENITDIKVVQAEQAKDLKYHIKRTTQIEEKLMPLHYLKVKVDAVFKVMGMVASFVAFCFGVIKLFFS